MHRLGDNHVAARVLDPAVVLFGSTRRRVLGWLLGRVDEAFYPRELLRPIGALVGAVQQKLGQLTAGGLVRGEAPGKQVYFQAIREAAIFLAVGLVAKTGGLVDILRHRLRQVARRVREVSSAPTMYRLAAGW